MSNAKIYYTYEPEYTEYTMQEVKEIYLQVEHIPEDTFENWLWQNEHDRLLIKL